MLADKGKWDIIRNNTLYKRIFKKTKSWIECLIQCWIYYDTQFNKFRYSRSYLGARGLQFRINSCDLESNYSVFDEYQIGICVGFSRKKHKSSFSSIELKLWKLLHTFFISHGKLMEKCCSVTLFNYLPVEDYLRLNAI